MDNEGIALVREIVEGLGCTVEQAWPHIVDYVHMQAVVALIVAGILVLSTPILGVVGVKSILYSSSSKCRDNDAYFFLGLICVVTGVAFAITALTLLSSWLPVLFEPTGGAIDMLIP